MSELQKRLAMQLHPKLDTSNLRRSRSSVSEDIEECSMNFELDLDELEAEFRVNCSPTPDFHDDTPSTRALDQLCDELDWISPGTPTTQPRAPPNTQVIPKMAIQPDAPKARNRSAAPAEARAARQKIVRSGSSAALGTLPAIGPRLGSICAAAGVNDLISPASAQTDWKRVRRLGCGAAGETWLVQRQQDGAVCALKEITKSRLYSDDDMADMAQEAAEWLGKDKSVSPERQATEEVALLAKMSHQHVVKYHGSFQSDQSLNILMEFCSGGDLQAQLRHHRSTREKMAEARVLKWCQQMLSALAYIHSLCILHRDVKPANVFLTENEDIKLGDFGISRVLEKGSSLASTHCGTPCYYSPERCRGQQYGTPSDVWALGCILFECLTLERPFKAQSLHDLVSSVLNQPTPKLPEDTNIVLQEVIELSLVKEPSQRGSVEALLRMANA